MTAGMGGDVMIRPLVEGDLPAADHIFRLAFGSFRGLAEPTAFAAGRDLVRTRWLADPSAALAAELDGQLVGLCLVARWGSVGYFGPVAIRPDLWDRGIAQRLLEPTMDLFADWGVTHAGLFTFPESAKHVGLYHKFGFWPRFLTPILEKAVRPTAADWSGYSALAPGDRDAVLRACDGLTHALYNGLSLEREIRAVATQSLGDTVLTWNESALDGFAVCHQGPRTEAGPETCYVKFGAVRPGLGGDERFDRLLDACEAFAGAHGTVRLVAGVNTARQEAYGRMVQRGFRATLQGVTMHRPNEPGYSRPGVYVLDDWR